MSRPKSIYVISLWLFFIFSIIFIVIDDMTSFKHNYLLFVHVLEYLLLFLDDNVDKESEKFSNKNFQVQPKVFA